MRQLLFVVVAACGVSVPSAQAFELPEVTVPRIAERAATPEAFVPPGWRVEHLARGRLDTNAREDALLVLRMDAAANVVDNDGMGPPRFDTNPRMLLALVAEADGRWRRVMVDHTLVPRPESPVMGDYLGDDASAAVAIRANRTWVVSLDSFASAGSWTMSNRTFTFRLEGDCMRGGLRSQQRAPGIGRDPDRKRELPDGSGVDAGGHDLGRPGPAAADASAIEGPGVHHRHRQRLRIRAGAHRDAIDDASDVMPSPRARLASSHAHWRARKTAHRRAREARTVIGRGDRRQSGLAPIVMTPRRCGRSHSLR